MVALKAVWGEENEDGIKRGRRLRPHYLVSPFSRLKTPFEVKERYVYDPRGLPMVLKSDWSGYDMTNGVPYGNNPKNSFNKSEITFRYLFGQQRWQGHRTHERSPKDFDAMLQGSAIESVYRQTLQAFNLQLSTLCGAGFRLLVEGICGEQGVVDGDVPQPNGTPVRKSNLQGKIRGLVGRGLISSRQADVLHQIRFLGNDAAHELDQPPITSLKAAFDIVDHYP